MQIPKGFTMAIICMLVPLGLYFAFESHRQSERVTANRTALEQCSKPGNCLGGYVVQKHAGISGEDRILRIDLAKDPCSNDQITLDELSKYKSNESFLKGIRIVLQTSNDWENTAVEHFLQQLRSATKIVASAN
ncbi:MAG: hypothetical protein G01um101449_375 [Parcubacteria group bacterium Gr01-1014_49]|nr:MAG: hypothetical protein G01um101449_375 [Parcubacteria group bacterium Gr01-1014_49]